MSEAQRHAAHDQLERMLANPLFKHSKRYPALLRYVVEHALDGHTEQMKERTLGIEVFGREPGYDTNLDPVVRTTAGEIRKRIAQYYHEPGHEYELRIEMPSGTYIPEFHAPPERLAILPAPADVLAPASAPVPVVRLRQMPLVIAATALLVVAVLAIVVVRPLFSRTALDRFWAPVLDASTPALLCVGQPHFAAFPGSTPTRQVETPNSNETLESTSPENGVSLRDLYKMGKHYISLWDSVTLTRVAAFLEAKSKPYRIRGELSTSLSDLRDGPAVLIGAFNNDWTLRLTGPLRFSFHNPQPHVFAIQDSQNKSADAWQVDTSTAYMKQTDDYAVISRIKDPTTDRFVVVAAGVAYWGTIAAGEFLTDPKYMEEFAKAAPRGWEKKNLQVVIGTKVIAGNSGPPRVLATYYW